MKATTLTLIVFFAAIRVAMAQSLVYESSKDRTIVDSATINLPAQNDNYSSSVLYFRLDKIPPGKTVHVTLKDDDSGTATLNTDYRYNKIIAGTAIQLLNTSFALNSSSPEFSIEIVTLKKKSTFAVLTIDADNGTHTVYSIKLNLNSSNKQPDISNPKYLEQVPDTAHWTLRVVTGGNFDFFNGASIKDFAGDITAFVPNMFKIKSLPVGIEFCISNFHYFDNDSTHSLKDHTAYFVKSADYYNPASTSPVVYSAQNVNKKYDYNVWEVHVAPLIPIKRNEFAQFFLKFQLEELATTETYTPTLAGVQNDTITYSQYQALKNSTNTAYPTPASHPLVLVAYKQHTYYDVYGGAGPHLTLNFKNVAALTVSSLIGMGRIELANPSFDPDPSNRDLLRPGHSLHETKFYSMSKFQVVTTVTPVNVVLGGEYRTVAGNMHYFATYLGAAITLDKIKQ